MGREFELKYAADPTVLAAIREDFGPFSAIAMETTYFDTPSHALSARKMTLRRRLENGISLCTLKTPGINGGRGEWEVVCDDISAAITLLLAAGCPEELAQLTQEGIAPVCAARFTRLAKEIGLPGGKAELALDEGLLMGGGREIPLWELEVEHKEGAESATEEFARALAARYQLTPEEKSKFRRAMDLARGEENG